MTYLNNGVEEKKIGFSDNNSTGILLQYKNRAGVEESQVALSKKEPGSTFV